MPSIIERDGRLMDPFTFTDGVAQLLHLAKHGQTLSAGPVIAVGDGCNLPAKSIARPERTVLGTGDLGKCSIGEERPGQRRLVDPALARQTTLQNLCVGRAAVGLVVVVARLDGLDQRLGEEDAVFLGNALAVALQAFGPDVMTEQVREGREKLRDSGSASVSNVPPVQVHHPR